MKKLLFILSPFILTGIGLIIYGAMFYQPASFYYISDMTIIEPDKTIHMSIDGNTGVVSIWGETAIGGSFAVTPTPEPKTTRGL